MLGSTSGLLLSLSPQHDEDEYLGEVTNSEYGSLDISLPGFQHQILISFFSCQVQSKVVAGGVYDELVKLDDTLTQSPESSPSLFTLSVSSPR